MEDSYHIYYEVVDRCIAGDRSAYKELYLLYEKAMYNVALRITNDEAEAEDVLQEAFISAFQYLHNFNRTSSFGAWLKRIVVNKSLDSLKKNRLDLTPIEDNMDIPQEIEETVATYKVDEVRDAITQLPDGYRTIFSLYLIEGYDHREIAEILGISESTSKTQYHRAKKKLLGIIKNK